MFPQLTSALAWWQWLILAAVPPAIVALYFLKLKRRPLVVPSTWLWQRSIEDLHVNTIWQRLRNNLLLFLQLLAVALAALALLQPAWQGSRQADKRLILLIDNSASMSATDVSPRRLDEAKRLAKEAIDGLASSESAMVIAFSDVAEVKQGFTDNRRELRRAIDAIEPTARRTSLVEALRVAAGLANPPQAADAQAEPVPATVMIFSDGHFDDPSGFSLGNLEPVFVPIGTGAGNVAIAALGVRRHEAKADRLQVFARLQNFGDETTVGLELALDGRPIDGARVTLGPRETRGAAFDLPRVDSGVLRLAATTGDAFSLDDQAWLALSPSKPAEVLLVTPGNEELRRAMTTAAAKELARLTTEPPAFLEGDAYREATAGKYALIVFDRCAPREMPHANTVFLGRLPPGGGWKAKPTVAAPQLIDVDPTHPLTRGLDFGDVEFVEATPLEPPPGGRVLLDSAAGPIVAIAPRDGFEDLVLGFVLTDTRPDGKPTVGTNWFVRPSFPLFVLAVLEQLGGEHGISLPTLLPGDQATVAGPPGEKVAIQSPSGSQIARVIAPNGKAAMGATEELGVYSSSLDGAQMPVFSVNLFDPAESEIAVREEIRIGQVGVSGRAVAVSAPRKTWRWLLACCLAVLMWEWYIYSRRVLPGSRSPFLATAGVRSVSREI